MQPLHRSKLFGGLAKSALPALSSCLAQLRMHSVVRYAEIGSSLLQGKGAGSGWNMSGELRAAASCIDRPDPVLLDVGANYGSWAMGMLRAFPAARTIMLFEPQKDCLAKLRQLELPGKIIIPCAVTDHSGEETLYQNGSALGVSSLYERSETFFENMPRHKINVSVTTLDSVLESEGIDFVDFVKFDIEGAELAAFRGAARSFSRGSIGALSLEFGSGNISSRTFFRDFWDFLTNHGFEIFRILPGGCTLRIDTYYEDLEYFRGVSNYIAKAKHNITRPTLSLGSKRIS
jgi:FkbM family methyltransferase